ncbi:MAG: sigma 54-interacting transcriptional regulator [Acidobacteria bacterium]|nr:sigma 54-interacting transcriptional regulator [Acidobacteriota bacterium]MCW5968871.1 sigma 54-interacting transcriptional regulator [Blastocatellales bacterium]
MRVEEGQQLKLLEMYEAREAILKRIDPDVVSVIDMDRFLQAAVTEVGRRLGVDRCNVITPAAQGGFRVSHEFLADDSLTPGIGLNIPPSLVPTETINQYLPRARHYSIDDIYTANVPGWVRTTCQLIGTRAVLLAPFVFRRELLGVMGLHYCREPHEWSETEVRLVEWLAGQVSIGLHYAGLYREKEKEVELTRLLLEISNDINTRTDFGEVASFVIDRAVELLEADYGCLGVLDSSGEHLHFDGVRGRRGFDLRKGVDARLRESRALHLADNELLRGMLDEGRTERFDDAARSPLAGYILTQLARGRSAVAAPITTKERVLGLIVLVRAEESRAFSDDEVRLLDGISNQAAIALEKDRLAAEVLRLKRELNDARSGERIIGSSPKIRKAIEMALSVADSQTTVLLQGESGTGKELLASLIQFNSRRAARPFIKINCGAIPQTLLETELFGHERGAFTDARSRRIGRFEEANGGTLFLDEIGEMSLAAQVSLLRVLQDGEFTRVGGSEVIKADVRIIAATNKDLEREIEAGRFRRDLFYRLNVYPIVLPPLRDRVEDIEQLAAFFIESFQQKSGRRVSGLSERALRRLKSYAWPGNVRELENCLERAVIVAAGRQITDQDLPEAVRASGAAAVVSRIELNLPATMEDVEREMISQMLVYTGGDKAKAARLLGIGRKTLYRKLEQYKHD